MRRDDPDGEWLCSIDEENADTMAGARKESCEKDTTSKETRIREIELYHREKEVAEREMVIMRRELELLRMSQRMDQKPNK